jgi:hypothetical protein
MEELLRVIAHNNLQPAHHQGGPLRLLDYAFVWFVHHKAEGRFKEFNVNLRP